MSNDEEWDTGPARRLLAEMPAAVMLPVTVTYAGKSATFFTMAIRRGGVFTHGEPLELTLTGYSANG